MLDAGGVAPGGSRNALSSLKLSRSLGKYASSLFTTRQNDGRMPESSTIGAFPQGVRSVSLAAALSSKVRSLCPRRLSGLSRGSRYRSRRLTRFIHEAAGTEMMGGDEAVGLA